MVRFAYATGVTATADRRLHMALIDEFASIANSSAFIFTADIIGSAGTATHTATER